MSRYKISAKGKSGEIFELKTCGGDPEEDEGKPNTSCNIDMDSLTRPPFNLKNMDKVVVAGRSQNSMGWSDFSDANSSTKLSIKA